MWAIFKHFKIFKLIHITQAWMIYWHCLWSLASWNSRHVPLWTELKDGHLTLKSQTKDPEMEQQDQNDHSFPWWFCPVQGSPYQMSGTNFLEYEIVVPKNVGEKMSLREFHLKASKKFLKTPLSQLTELILIASTEKLINICTSKCMVPQKLNINHLHWRFFKTFGYIHCIRFKYQEFTISSRNQITNHE